MRGVLLTICFLFALELLADANLRFAELSNADKSKLVSEVCNCMGCSHLNCCTLFCSVEDRFSRSWPDLPYSKDAFTKMKLFDLHPARIEWTLESANVYLRSKLSGLEPCYVYLNEESDVSIAERRIEDVISGRYSPILCPDGSLVLSFVRRQHKPLRHCQEIEVLHPELAKNYLNDSVCSNLWATSVFTIVSNCAFKVECGTCERDLRGLLNANDNKRIERQLIVAKEISASAPLVCLTRREATELVYVTALCRGVVKTLKEFNEKYVGKGPAFIVRLSNPKCETEFGRMLYDAAKDKGLFGAGSAKGETESNSFANGYDLWCNRK